MKRARSFLLIILMHFTLFLMLSCRHQSEEGPIERYLSIQLLSPSAAAVEVDRNIQLKWLIHAHDANSRPPSCNLYFGTDNDPGLLDVVPNDGSDVKYSVGPLSPGIKYYWKVTAFDETPEESSKIQSFQVASVDRKIWSSLTYFYEMVRLEGDKLFAAPYKKVCCVDSESGTIVWDWENENPTSDLAISQGRVFIPSKCLNCLNADTGDPLWVSDAGEYMWGDVRCLAGKVFSVNGRLYCMDADTGETIWSYGNANKNGEISERFSITGERVVCVRSSSAEGEGRRLFCLDVETGDLLWEHGDWSLEYVFYGPVASGDHICLKTGGELRTYDLTSGQLLWTYPTPFNCGDTPFIYQEKVFTNSGDNQFVMLDLVTGQEIWRVDHIGTSTIRSGDPVVMDGILYFTLDEGYVMALDVLSGSIIWVYYIDATGDGIALLGEHAFLITKNGGLHCIVAK